MNADMYRPGDLRTKARLVRSVAHHHREQRADNRTPTTPSLCLWFGSLCLVMALMFAGKSLWIDAKALLAQHLMQVSWQTAQATGGSNVETPPPWPWADVRPVAKLSGDVLPDALLVLSDVSGEAMAFGPGLAAGDPDRMTEQTLVFGGHRDTHMSFMQDLVVGMHLEVENIAGEVQRYRVDALDVLDTRHDTLQVASDSAGLVLLTCYPFNALQTGGPLRYVAVAHIVDSDAPMAGQARALYPGKPADQPIRFSSKG